ncbi:hypothetical protein LCGC14_1642450 [marine sediment metagenome]|uniref:Uncharacterized protein n=1 Tax=marine sediment metagenome TaxID=412755 RepID=A0A0F9HZ57_9ZZZZ
MTGHTPGPWDWDQGDDGTDYSHPYCTVTSEDGDLIIAEVNDRFDREIGAANAHLIAAAPKLLAALNALVSPQHAHSQDCTCPWCGARAAIAAAQPAEVQHE